MIRNILLVEDDRASRRLMDMAFQEAAIGASLHMAENGEEALDFLKKRGKYPGAPRPEMILLDLNLPGKSGASVLEEIRGDDRLKEIPVVILTGSNASQDIKISSRFTRCRYLLKPTHYHELVLLVKSLPQI